MLFTDFDVSDDQHSAKKVIKLNALDDNSYFFFMEKLNFITIGLGLVDISGMSVVTILVLLAVTLTPSRLGFAVAELQLTSLKVAEKLDE